MSFVKLGMMMGLFAAAASLALAACGGDSEPQSTTVGQVQVRVATVEYVDGGFVPNRVEVDVGADVRFLNRSDGPFWPASNIHPTHQVYPGFDAKGPIGQGEAWVFNFDKPGVWRYHNHLSPTDGATIVVRGEATAPRTVREAIDPADLQFKELGEVSAETAFDLFNDDALLISYVREYGPANVIRVLSEHGNQAGDDCHPRAHDLGGIAYQLFGTTAFSLSGHDCQSGSYHGALESLFQERGTENIQAQIAEACGSGLSSYYLYQCIHGVGHGVMAWTNYALPEALVTCDRLSTVFNRQSCYSGVFMENVVGGLTGSMGHITTYLSDDPHYPCNILAERYLSSCYFFQTSRMIELFAGDFERVAAACLETPVSIQSTCFQSMGRDTWGWSGKNPAGALALCDGAIASNNHSDCMVGAVEAIFYLGVGLEDNALTFCGLVEGDDERGRCYRSTVARAHQIYDNPDDLLAFCARLEEGYRTGCP